MPRWNTGKGLGGNEATRSFVQQRGLELAMEGLSSCSLQKNNRDGVGELGGPAQLFLGGGFRPEGS